VPGVLYVVATPIGNLEDITLGALGVRGAVDLIAAEDTRHTGRLLAHFGIRTPLESYYDRVEAAKAPRLVKALEAGRSLALVTDAGTPGISDPGYRLVRRAWEAGIRVVPIPGASALTALLSCAGVPAHRVAFEGFLPARRRARLRALEGLRADDRALVFFESARRLRACLADVLSVLGDREAAIGRELTKMHEEILRGRLSELSERIGARSAPKGEVTVVVAPAARVERETAAAGVPAEEILALTGAGVSLKEAARRLAKRYGVPAREVYAQGLRLRGAT
jgi:16S rRNA (cytidine1402-2'-O)-methyltransferase